MIAEALWVVIASEVKQSIRPKIVDYFVALRTSRNELTRSGRNPLRHRVGQLGVCAGCRRLRLQPLAEALDLRLHGGRGQHGEVRGQMIAQLARVIRSPVDERGLTPAQERHAHQIHPRRIHNAAVVADPALTVEHRDLQPGKGDAIARGPYDRPDITLSKIDAQRRVIVDERRRQTVRRIELRVAAIVGRPAIEGIEQAAQLEIGHGALVGQGSGTPDLAAAETDHTSGVTALRVKAYRPEDALTIARALLSYSEQLVNELNERARTDAVSTSEHEVDRAQAQISRIQDQLTAYRIKQNMLDPKTASTGVLELIGQMRAAQATARQQLGELMRNSPCHTQLIVRITVRSGLGHGR